MAAEKLNLKEVVAAFTAGAGLTGVTIIQLENIATDPSFFKVVSLVGPLLFFVAFVCYYFKLRGEGEAAGSDSLKQFEQLRENFGHGGGFEGAYVSALGRTLKWLDDFMGDRIAEPSASLARKAPVPSHGPTWTAAAYDRCLLLALLYPLVSMFLVWVWSGQAGVAERAIGLETGITPFARWAGVALSALVAFVAYHFKKSHGVRPRILYGLFLSSVSATVAAIAGPGAGAVTVAVAVVVASAGAGAAEYLGVYAGGFAVLGALAIAVVLAIPGAFALAVAGAGAVAFILGGTLLAPLGKWLPNRGILYAFESVLPLLTCYALAWRLGGDSGWNQFLALLLFFGLLTLINAPFDWFAIGFTRWLLRMGLARGGPYPLLFAAFDAFVALLSVAALAFICVVAVQFYGDLAVHHARTVLNGEGESARIIEFADLFKSLEVRGTDYENWWIWLMLFSTAIPSVVNLIIACLSVTRGLPQLGHWMNKQLRDDGETPERVKFVLAAILSAQITIGTLVAAWLTYALVTRVGPWVAPVYAGWLRETSRWLAACNVPEHVLNWLSGSGWGPSCW